MMTEAQIRDRLAYHRQALAALGDHRADSPDHKRQRAAIEGAIAELERVLGQTTAKRVPYARG